MGPKFILKGLIIIIMLSCCDSTNKYQTEISGCNKAYAVETVKFEDNNLLMNCVLNADTKRTFKHNENSI